MFRKIAVFALVLPFVIFADAVQITGTVTDQASGDPIAAATVKLKNNPSIAATTGNDGKYALSGDVAVSTGFLLKSQALIKPVISIRGRTVQIAGIQGPSQFRLYNYSGAEIHAIEPPAVCFKLPSLAAGLYIAELKSNSTRYRWRCVSSNGAFTVLNGDMQSAESNSSLAKRSADAIDELIVSAAGYQTKNIPISAYSLTKDIALTKASADGRVSDGLVALYTFKEGSGSVISDVSGVESPLNIDIKNNNNNEATWIDGGGPTIKPTNYKRFEASTDAQIVTSGPAAKITSASKASNKITFEAWVKLATLEQAGPERIVTISNDAGNRNISFCYQSDHWYIRMRTTSTSNNGLPCARQQDKSLATTEITHFLYTFDETGPKIYLNGKKVAISIVNKEGSHQTISGTLSNWNDSYTLGLGNEFNNPRAWWGDLYLIAFYDRALTADEVAKNFAAKY